jgi:hypothetical protein
MIHTKFTDVKKIVVEGGFPRSQETDVWKNDGATARRLGD